MANDFTTEHDDRVGKWLEAIGVDSNGLIRLELVIGMDDIVHVKTWRYAEGDMFKVHVPFGIEERPQRKAAWWRRMLVWMATRQ